MYLAAGVKTTWDNTKAVVMMLLWPNNYWHLQRNQMAMEEPLYFNPSKKHKVDTNTACQRTQTDGIKDIST